MTHTRQGNMRTIHLIILCLAFQLRDADKGCGKSTVFATLKVKTLRTMTLDMGPLYSQSYRRPSEKCGLTIKTNGGMRVRVTVKYSDILLDLGCYFATIDFYDRNSPNTQERHLAEGCGGGQYTLTSWSNYMRVHALSRVTVPIKVEYSAENYTPCFREINMLEGEIHTIQSKGYPKQYDRNTECRWKINTLSQYNKKQTVILNFVDVDIKYSEDCLFNYIQIYSDSTPLPDAELAVMCGKERRIIELYIKSILIVFKTGNEEVGKGFKLIYQASNASSCDRILTATGDERVLTSENYPSGYPSFQRCAYLIQPRTPIKNIKLEVTSSNFGWCHEAYVLLVYDGETENATLLGNLCDKPRPTYKSLRGSLYIVLVSKDNLRTKRIGFRALYKEEMCGEEITVGEEKSILKFPPVAYLTLPDPVTCKWTIKTQHSSNKVFVHFTNTYMLWPSTKIRVDNGSGYIRELYNSANQMYMSTGGRMDIELISDGGFPAVHFDMQYWSEDARGCDGDKRYLVAKDYTRTLRSPGYPIGYPENMSCVWQIQTESILDKIKITVEVNEMEKTNCDDFISFFYGFVSNYSEPDLIVCGGETNIFYSENNFATVHLNTDKHKGGRGFVLNYGGDSDIQQIMSFVIGPAAGAVLLLIIIRLLCVCVRRQREARPPAEPELPVPNSCGREQTSPFLETNTPAPPRPPPSPTAPHPSYLELGTSPASAERSQLSAPPLPSSPPPSYEDALSKGMIQNSETGV